MDIGSVGVGWDKVLQTVEVDLTGQGYLGINQWQCFGEVWDYQSRLQAVSVKGIS